MTTIADWLEAVGEGLGVHAWAIEGYGAANVGLLGALDDEAIKEIGTLLRYDGRRAATAADQIHQEGARV